MAATPPTAEAGAAPLLRFGLIAGPFYLAVGLGQALTREGFDLARHPLSLLANGPGGWIQTVNFALTGAMVVAAAVGFHRLLGPGARAWAWFLGAFGLSMIAAALFPADPVDGFPPGTPRGFPTHVSTIGIAHFVAGAIGFLCLAVSPLLAAPALRRRGRPALAWLSLASGLLVLFGFFGGLVVPIGVAGIWLAVVVGWAWLFVLSLRLG